MLDEHDKSVAYWLDTLADYRDNIHAGTELGHTIHDLEALRTGKHTFTKEVDLATAVANLLATITAILSYPFPDPVRHSLPPPPGAPVPDPSKLPSTANPLAPYPLSALSRQWANLTPAQRASWEQSALDKWNETTRDCKFPTTAPCHHCGTMLRCNDKDLCCCDHCRIAFEWYPDESTPPTSSPTAFPA